MTLADELKQCGCDQDPRDFRDLLIELHQAMHPAWTDEDLLFHPYDALRYCETVRRRTCQGLPDELILRTLLNVRKNRLAFSAQEE